MLRKIICLVIVLSLLPAFLFAQERTRVNKEVIPAKWVKYRNGQLPKNTIKSKQYHYRTHPDGTLTLIDTLYINPPGTLPPSGNTNFGFFGQDRMTQWFVAPANLSIKEVGFDFISINQPPPQLEVKIVNVSKPASDLEYMDENWWGWFEASGNGQHDATCFWDDPDRTGNWIPSPVAPDPDSTFGTDILSDGGVGQTFIPENDTVNIDTYQFVDLEALGYNEIPAGTVFGVALKNLDPILGGGKRVGILGPAVGTGGTYQYSLQKFYADANTNPDQCPTLDCYGLWSRDIALSYAVVVEIYETPLFEINSFTQIPSDVVLGPFDVDADIPFATSAYLRWSANGGAMDSVMMANTGGYIWSAQIPVQLPNTTVTYSISAFDDTGLYIKSASRNFQIYEPSGATTLVVFNGFMDLTGFPQDDYFGPNVSFDHDTWNYGALTAALLDYYTNVIEIWFEASGVYNNDIVRAWLEGAANRNYYLASQEYLGANNGYTDSAYTTGTFEYDILGIDSSFNDVSYAGVSGQQDIPTLVMPVANTQFGQPLLDLFNSITPPPDSMMYFPTYITGNDNWQDAFHAVSLINVDMIVETRGIKGVPEVDTLPTMLHRTLPAGNKIVFAAYDPIALTTGTDSSFAYYYWVGGDISNSVYQALKWFGIIPDVVEPQDAVISEFRLQQNYPNPFNPSTKIKFTIPSVETGYIPSLQATLKVYDVLGREIITLVNEEKPAGNYELEFDGTALPSGVYFYQLKAGNFVETKKMILIR